MWLPKGNGEKKEDGHGLVAVAIDKDTSSQYALKWAVDNLLGKGQIVILVHVKQKVSSGSSLMANFVSVGGVSDKSASASRRQLDYQTKELFLPFRCFCTRKDVAQCQDVVLEDLDIPKALIEFVSHTGIDNLVIGSSTRNTFMRFKTVDIPSNVSKGAPDFCTVYVVSKGKISSVRSASRPTPSMISPIWNQMQSTASLRSNVAKPYIPHANNSRVSSASSVDWRDTIKWIVLILVIIWVEVRKK